MKFKKIICFICAITLISSLVFSTTCFASGIKVTINGQNVNFDQSPIVQNDRTLVPLRAIFEAMGATVLWDEKNQVINVATEFGMMTLGIGSNYISYRNENEDRSIVCDVPPQIIGNRTLVPVRAIAECTGYNVDWDESTQTVVITGEIKGLTLPNASISKYYADSTIPDFGACVGGELIKEIDGEHMYSGITGKQVVEYVETYLVSAGFLIDDDREIFGVFIFKLSNSKTGETVRMTYTKSDKTLIIVHAR